MHLILSSQGQIHASDLWVIKQFQKDNDIYMYL